MSPYSSRKPQAGMCTSLVSVLASGTGFKAVPFVEPSVTQGHSPKPLFVQAWLAPVAALPQLVMQGRMGLRLAHFLACILTSMTTEEFTRRSGCRRASSLAASTFRWSASIGTLQPRGHTALLNASGP